jgi:hypothetical protein
MRMLIDSSAQSCCDFAGSGINGHFSEKEQTKKWAIRRNLGARLLTIASAQSRIEAFQRSFVYVEESDINKRSLKRRANKKWRYD